MQRLRISKRWDRQAGTSFLSGTSARDNGDIYVGAGSVASGIDNRQRRKRSEHLYNKPGSIYATVSEIKEVGPFYIKVQDTWLQQCNESTVVQKLQVPGHLSVR